MKKIMAHYKSWKELALIKWHGYGNILMVVVLGGGELWHPEADKNPKEVQSFSSQMNMRGSGCYLSIKKQNSAGCAKRTSLWRGECQCEHLRKRTVVFIVYTRRGKNALTPWRRVFLGNIHLGEFSLNLLWWGLSLFFTGKRLENRGLLPCSWDQAEL